MFIGDRFVSTFCCFFLLLFQAMSFLFFRRLSTNSYNNYFQNAKLFQITKLTIQLYITYSFEINLKKKYYF